jgi:tRNA(Arg) A34 adenosine deaminase TadA
MKEACYLAEISIIRGGGPFGCVITDSSENIIGKGHNRVTIDNDPTLHAEMVAIKDACRQKNTFNLSGSTLYTSCEPCPMCLSAIYWARIDTVFYGNTRVDASNIGFDDSFIYEQVNKPMEDRSIQMTQVGHENAKEAFRIWKLFSKRIDY